VLMTDVAEPKTQGGKLKILWWTRDPRQHEMLASYDRVLSAIADAFNRMKPEDQPRAA